MSSPAPLLTISGYTNAALLSGMHHLTATPRTEGVLLDATGANPSLEFPQFEIPSGQRGILRISITAAKPTHLRVFCSAEFQFCHTGSAGVSAKAGNSGFYFALPGESGPMELKALPK